MTELVAYTDAVEERLDDRGTARQFVEGAREDVDDLDETVAELEAFRNEVERALRP